MLIQVVVDLMGGCNTLLLNVMYISQFKGQEPWTIRMQ